MTKTVVFIHGAWLTPDAWSAWRERFEGWGYETVAPPWPHMNRPAEALRRSPDPALAKLTIGKLVEHYASIVEALPSPPILIGHSFGGLIVQKLLDRGLGSAGIALDPVAPRGVLPGPRAVLSALPILASWNGWNRIFTMARSAFDRTFANALPEATRADAFAKQIVPAPGRPFFQAALGIGNAIRFGNIERPPLLLIAGQADRTIEARMVLATAAKYSNADVPAELFTYSARSHFLFAEPGWEVIADDVRQWLFEERLGVRQSPRFELAA